MPRTRASQVLIKDDDGDEGVMAEYLAYLDTEVTGGATGGKKKGQKKPTRQKIIPSSAAPPVCVPCLEFFEPSCLCPLCPGDRLSLSQ